MSITGEKILVIEKPSAEHPAYDNRAFDVEDKGVATEGTPARPRRVKKTRDQVRFVGVCGRRLADSFSLSNRRTITTTTVFLRI